MSDDSVSLGDACSHCRVRLDGWVGSKTKGRRLFLVALCDRIVRLWSWFTPRLSSAARSFVMKILVSRFLTIWLMAASHPGKLFPLSYNWSVPLLLCSRPRTPFVSWPQQWPQPSPVPCAFLLLVGSGGGSAWCQFLTDTDFSLKFLSSDRELMNPDFFIFEYKSYHVSVKYSYGLYETLAVAAYSLHYCVSFLTLTTANTTGDLLSPYNDSYCWTVEQSGSRSWHPRQT